MKKGGKKEFEEVDLSSPKEIVEVLEEKYIIKNGDEYPNRLIGHLKIRIEVPQLDDYNCKGSGCMIADGYFLTAAHNVDQGYKLAQQYDNNKAPWKDTSYVKQGLGSKKQGNQPYVAQFSILNYFVNPSYDKKIEQTLQLKKYAESIAKQTSNNKEETAKQFQERVSKKLKQLKEEMNDMKDFAILKVKPVAQQIKEQYMPIVVISEQTFKKKITNISVFGYPVDFSKAKLPNQGKSSVYINSLYGNSSNWKSYERNCITYDLITEKGISGSPIIASYDGKFIIIAIHKGGDRQNKLINVGVGAGQMIESLNELGYRQQKKPFVFTEKTLYLHGQDNEIESREILFLMDKGFGPIDMLVYTSYNLSNIQKILLSGNEIGDQGVQYLLRRKYPKLHALFLTQNKIGNLSNIPEENWKNIEALTVLGLSVNELTEIPKGFLHLKKLQKLWLNHNQIKDISLTLIDLCKQNNRESLTVYLHTNSINLAQEENVISQLKKLRTRTVWEKQGGNA